MPNPDIAAMNDNNYFSETKEEIASRRVIRPALDNDEYIAKVAKIELKKFPAFDKMGRPSKTEKALMYNIVLLPYKLKTEDTPMKSSDGKEVEPLTAWTFKKFSPFSVGLNMTTKDPTLLRQFTAFVQGQSPSMDTPPTVPDWVILNQNDEFVSDEAAFQYKADHIKVRKNEMTRDEFVKRHPSEKHVWDIRSFEGKYIGVRISVKEGDDGIKRNQVVNFSKAPTSFTPDKAVEEEKMVKFAESYQKIQDKWDKEEGKPTVEETSVADVARSLETGDDEVVTSTTDEDIAATGKKVAF